MEIFWIWAISICIGGAVWIVTFLFGPAILERRPDIGALIVGILSALGLVWLQGVVAVRWPFIVLGIITVIIDVLFILAIRSEGGEDDDYHYR